MIQTTADPNVLKAVPTIIDKKRHHFVPRVLRRNKPKCFAELIVGETFRILSENVKPHERQLILRKTKASEQKNNAVVVTTFYPNTNPLGQVWTIDGHCPIEKE